MINNIIINMAIDNAQLQRIWRQSDLDLVSWSAATNWPAMTNWPAKTKVADQR
jgi:hypothetical protein